MSLSRTAQTRLQWMLFYFFNGRNGVRTCRHFGISRQTFYRWRRRFDRHDLTTNNYLFAGEQFDPDLNLYYSRARYLNTSTGRFMNMDSLEGDSDSPSSLHKYLYAGGDPVNNTDPSGHDFDLGSTLVATASSTTIFGLSAIQSAVVINGVLGALIASSTAGIGAYLEGQNPEQIQQATGNLYNIAIGTLLGIAGGFAGADRK